MRVLAGPELAAAVTATGGLGFIGPNTKTQNATADLENARKLVRTTHQPQAKSSTLPIGIGYQLWSDDLGTAAEQIQQFQPCVAWLYAPEDEARDFASWFAEIRRASPSTQIWIQIGTVAEVERLLQSPELPDAIVVQGSEAGGHGRAEDGIGLMTLLPEIVDLLREQRVQIPVLAAGGIADGRGVAAALCLGADGVAMGTRFLASKEARISKGYQEEIVRASDGAANTTRTLLYNHLRGTYGWPKPYAPRTIINRTFIEHKDGASFEELQKLHDEAAARGDEAWGPEGRVATYASASIGLIKDVKSAGSIVQDAQRDALAILGIRGEEGAVRSSL